MTRFRTRRLWRRFLAHLRGQASHDVVDRGLKALERMEHRGATGAEPTTGDGAGILIQIPHRLFERECVHGRILTPEAGTPLAALPPAGKYAVGLIFSSPDPQAAALAKLIFAMVVRQEGQILLGWRRVPTDNRSLGQTARSVEPVMDHAFVAPGAGVDDAGGVRAQAVRDPQAVPDDDPDERHRRHEVLPRAEPVVADPHVQGHAHAAPGARVLPRPRRPAHRERAGAVPLLAFSTNTFPTWGLAQPFHLIAHNGEINTLRGNLNWMRAREPARVAGVRRRPAAGAAVSARGSDSTSLDEVLELLVRSGRRRSTR